MTKNRHRIPCYFLSLLMLTFAGCTVAGSTTNKHATNAPVPIAASGSVVRPFAITDPKDKASVDRNIITVSGTGARPGDIIKLDVITDRIYPQDGTFQIGPDDGWTYSPCYIYGQGAYRLHHKIIAKLIRGGKLVDQFIVNDVRGPEPQ